MGSDRKVKSARASQLPAGCAPPEVWRSWYAPLLRRLAAGDTARAIGLCGASPRAGVTTVAIHVAAVAADALGKRVLLIDANPHRPALAERLDLAPRPDYGEVLAGLIEHEAAVRPTAYPNVWAVPGGAAAEEFATADGEHYSAALEPWRGEYDLLVLDLPCTSAPGFPRALAGLLDGLVVVAEAERTPVAAIQRAQRDLASARANAWGVVLSKQREYVPGWLQRLTDRG